MPGVGVQGRLAPCLDALFRGVATEAALDRVAALGFAWFEFWDWRERDVDAAALAARRLGLRPVAFSGNTFGEPLVDGARRETALAHLDRSLDLAVALGASLLVAHAGYALAGRSRADQWTALVSGLRAAGDLAARRRVRLAVEPLNSRIDHPGYFLDSLPDARRLIDDVAHPCVGLLLDVYHMRVMHEDMLALLPSVLDVTVHVHVADVPGRREPGSGTIPWPEVIAALEEGGYRGAIGLECWPSGSVEKALRRAVIALGSPR